MKWIKLPTDFWERKSTQVLLERFGPIGPQTYIWLLTNLGMENQTWEDVDRLHQEGATKTIRGWARNVHLRSDKLTKILQSLEDLQEITILLSDPKIYTIRFLKLHEFLHRDALSSKYRSVAGRPAGGPRGGPAGVLREDKRREEKKNTDVAQNFKVRIKTVGSAPATRIWNFETKKRDAQSIAKKLLEKAAPPTTPAPLGPCGGLLGSKGKEDGEVGEGMSARVL